MRALYGKRDLHIPEMNKLHDRHMFAIVDEGLSGNYEVAAELAWRDMQIAALRKTLTELQSEIEREHNYDAEALLDYLTGHPVQQIEGMIGNLRPKK